MWAKSKAQSALHKVLQMACLLCVCLTLTACPLPESTMSEGGAEGASGGDVDSRATGICKPLGMTSPHRLEKAFACRQGDTPQTLGIVSYIHSYMECKLNRMTQDIFQSISGKSWYGPALGAAATLVVALYSSTLLLGIQKFRPYDVVANLIRISAVVFLATNWGNFSDFVKDFFEGMVNSMSANLAGAFHDPTTPGPPVTGVQFMDQIIGDIVSYNTLKIILALVGTGGSGWLYALMMCVIVFSYMWGLFTAVYIVLLALVGRHLLYALAPMFLVFLLFNYTRDMFTGWIKQLTAFTLRPILIFAVLGFLKTIYDYYMSGLIISTTNICYKQLWPMPGDIIQLNWWQFGTAEETVEGPNAVMPFSFSGMAVLTMIAFVMRYMFTWADTVATDLSVVTVKKMGTMMGWATVAAAGKGVAGVALGGVGGAVGGLLNTKNISVMRNSISERPVLGFFGGLAAVGGNVVSGATSRMASRAGQGVRDTMKTAASDIFGVDQKTMNAMAGRKPVPAAGTRAAKLNDIAEDQKKERLALEKNVDKAFEKLRGDTDARKSAAATAGVKKAGQQMSKQAELLQKGLGNGGKGTAQRAAITQLLQRQQGKLQKIAEATDKDMQKYSKQREGELRKGITEMQEAQDKKLEELLANGQKKREELAKQQQERRKTSTLSKAELTKKESEEFKKLNDELKVERARFDAISKQEEDALRSAHSKGTAEGLAKLVAEQNAKKKEVVKEFNKDLDGIADQISKDGEGTGTTIESVSRGIQQMREEAEREEAKDNAKQTQDLESNVFDADRRVVEVAKQEQQLKKEQKQEHKNALAAAGATQKEVESLMKKADEETEQKMAEARKSATGSEKATVSWLFSDGEGKEKERPEKEKPKDEAPPTTDQQQIDQYQKQRDDETREKERQTREDAEAARRKKRQEEEDEELNQALEETRKADEAAKKNKPES